MSAKKSDLLPPKPPPELFILQVEDNADDRTLFQMAGDQTQNPIRWHSVASADEAIAYLKELRTRGRHESVRWPDLMLLDIIMPLESGLEVLRFMSENPDVRRFRVVVLTGYEDRKLEKEARALGAHSICLKPQGFEGLTSLMNSLYHSWARAVKVAHSAEPEHKEFLVLYFANLPDNETGLRAACERAGMDVRWLTFESMEKGLSHLQTLNRIKAMASVDWPDLVLLDLDNKDDAAWKVLQFIRSSSELHDLPVVAFTPGGERELAIKANKLGARSLVKRNNQFEQNIELMKALQSAWSIALPERRASISM